MCGDKTVAQHWAHCRCPCAVSQCLHTGPGLMTGPSAMQVPGLGAERPPPWDIARYGAQPDTNCRSAARVWPLV